MQGAIPKPSALQWQERYSSRLGISLTALSHAFDGLRLSVACSGAGTLLYCCRQLLGTNRADVLSADDSDPFPRQWMQQNFNPEHIFQNCDDGLHGGPCPCHPEVAHCEPHPVSEDIFGASSPCVLFSNCNNLGKVRLLLPTTHFAGHPLHIISERIDIREPSVYIWENIDAVLKPYDVRLIQTPYEKDFVARYPRPIDYILYGRYNGKAIGLALKPAYHFAWWRGNAKSHMNTQMRARVFFLLVHKSKCSPHAFTHAVHVASVALQDPANQVTPVSELAAYVEQLDTPALCPDPEQASVLFLVA